jgi:anti-sigma B factor antagonist
MTWHVERGDGQVLLAVTGDLDIASAAEFRDVSLRALGIDPVTLVLDLTDVPFIDSSGIAVLVLLRRKARSRRSELRLVTHRRIDSVLRVTGLTQAFDIYDSREAAVSGAGQPA